MSVTDIESAAPSTARPVTDIPSMLLPVGDKQLLLPGVAVAEIVNYSYPERPDDAPAWFYGNITWRKLSVPVVSFEILNGQEMPRNTSGRRIAVLNNTGVHDALPFIAIVIQGIPRLVRITTKDITEETGLSLAPAERMAARLANSELVFVPDVGELERACCKYQQLR
ncbi:MAG TPA: chemotaxis protein CheW [Pseudomonadales bacterium]|nr:chemotaxis protein CheW [Pseudomonadales bacterium]